jgi:hypothetical protein
LPRYAYQCEDCERVFEVSHSMMDRYELCSQCCSDCECKGKVKKIPTGVTVVSGNSDAAAGRRIKNFIQNAREEIENEIEKSRNEEIKK